MARNFARDSLAAEERAACRNVPKRKGSAAMRLRIISRGTGRTFPSLRALLALHAAIHWGVTAQPRRVVIFGVRYRIKHALGEGAAPAEPFQRERGAAPRAFQFDGFLRVIRARRIKLAGSAKKSRKENLVKLHQGEQPPRA